MPPSTTLKVLVQHTLPHLSSEEAQRTTQFEQSILDSALGQQGRRRKEEDWTSLVDELGRAGTSS